jgi:general stress protein 26
MKILNASPGFGKPLQEKGLKEFLSRSTLQLHVGTLDEKLDINIHPVWYHYNPENNRLYFNTSKLSKKLSNIQNNADKKVYFCVDEPVFPYRGARGKGIAKAQHSTEFNMSIAKKIMIKYYGDLENPQAKAMLELVKEGNSIIVDIEPLYFSTWDYSETG